MCTVFHTVSREGTLAACLVHHALCQKIKGAWRELTSCFLGQGRHVWGLEPVDSHLTCAYMNKPYGPPYCTSIAHARRKFCVHSVDLQ